MLRRRMSLLSSGQKNKERKKTKLNRKQSSAEGGRGMFLRNVK
jgi:hypothetical protein